MKQDHRRTDRGLTYTELIHICAGALLTAGVLLAAYIIGPSVYPWLQSIGVGS
jgi:hypothetical protein